MKLVEAVASIVCATLLDPHVLAKARRRKKAFTRNNGKLPFLTVVKLLLANSKKTIAATLDGFFKEVSKSAGLSDDNNDIIICSQQAFSKARGGIDHTISKNALIEFWTFFVLQKATIIREDLEGYGEFRSLQLTGLKSLFLHENSF